MICGHTPYLWVVILVGGWVGQLVGSCQIIRNRVNRHLIEIIEFCLKIYDLWRHPHLWVSVWVDGSVIVWVRYLGGVMLNHQKFNKLESN